VPPVLFTDCIFVWEAFVALSNPRGGMTAIKFSEIEPYLNLNGISNLERRQEVTHLIRIMDESFIIFMKEKRKQENAST